MPLKLSYAQTQVPALCGTIPGSDRDLGQSPLNPQEETVLEWVKQTLPAARKALKRHGLAFDKDLLEAWKEFYAAENDVRDGKIASHSVPKPDGSSYAGGWYECVDCKARDGGSPIRLEFEHGRGIMLGERKEFIETRYDPLKWSRGQQGADVDVKRSITIYCGWLCPRCWRQRERDKIVAVKKEQAEQAERFERQFAELEPAQEA